MKPFVAFLTALAMPWLGVGGALHFKDGSNSTGGIKQRTDDLLFNTDLLEFQWARVESVRAKCNPKDPPCGPYCHDTDLDWQLDNCSWALDRGFENYRIFKFTWSCWRHDFGYANYKRQGRWNEANRKRIDIQFYKDMKSQCTESDFRLGCMYMADMYYRVVRKIGNNLTSALRSGLICPTDSESPSDSGRETEEET